MIKVKVKTLILTAIGILFLVFDIIPFANIELANHLSNSHPTIAEKLYNNYIKYPMVSRKDEALYNKSQNLMNNYIKYYIFLGGKLHSGLIDNTTIIEVIENNERIIKEYPKSKYYSNAYKTILDTYIYIGNDEELKKWIAWGKEQDNSEVRGISTLYDGYIHFVNRKYTEVEEILKDFTLGNEDMDLIYNFLRGHIAFAMEDFEKALEYYEKTSWQYGANFFGSLVPEGRKHWLSTLDFHNGDNKIRGRVTVDGVGIPFVEVYIQYVHRGYSISDNNFIAITDENGYFETIGIKEGKYDIGIGIGSPLLFDKVYLDKSISSITVDGDMEFNFQFTTPMKVISPKQGEIVKDNKFMVEWETVEGAEYYTVFSIGFEDPVNKKGSSIIFGLIDENKEYQIKDSRAIFDLSIINERWLGNVFYSPDEIINPQAILGYFHNGAEMPIIVSSYDKDGNKLNSSIPLAAYYDNVPSIKIEGIDLTFGEELILNGEYERAIEYYKNLLNEEDDNIEALKYLSRIHMVNWKKDKKDIVKSIGYSIKLYELTRDTSLLSQILVQMVPNEQRQHKELIEKIISTISKEDMDEELYNHISAYYRYIGEFQKARDIMTKNKDFALLPDIIYIDIYLEDYEIALERIKDENVKFEYMDKEKLIKGIETLENIDKNNKDYLKFKDYLYRLISRELGYNDSYIDFKKVYDDVNNEGIRIILNEIRKENRWD